MAYFFLHEYVCAWFLFFNSSTLTFYHSSKLRLLDRQTSTVKAKEQEKELTCLELFSIASQDKSNYLIDRGNLG